MTGERGCMRLVQYHSKHAAYQERHSGCTMSIPYACRLDLSWPTILGQAILSDAPNHSDRDDVLWHSRGLKTATVIPRRSNRDEGAWDVSAAVAQRCTVAESATAGAGWWMGKLNHTGPSKPRVNRHVRLVRKKR